MGGETLLSFSLLAFRDNQVKAEVSFLVGAAGLDCDPDCIGNADGDGMGLFPGDSAGGDQGIDGRAWVKLLSESVLEVVVVFSLGRWSLAAAGGAMSLASSICMMISYNPA